MTPREHELNRRIHHAIALGTIAAAERDGRSALNDTLSQIINDLCAERDTLQAKCDALQALVCEIAVIRRGSLDGGGYAFLSADLLDRLDAAAKVSDLSDAAPVPPAPRESASTPPPA